MYCFMGVGCLFYLCTCVRSNLKSPSPFFYHHNVSNSSAFILIFYFTGFLDAGQGSFGITIGGERRQPKDPGCFSLTDVYGGLPPQQQFQTLAVVGQAAVVQRRAAFHRLLVQVQTAPVGTNTQRETQVNSFSFRTSMEQN